MMVSSPIKKIGWSTLMIGLLLLTNARTDVLYLGAQDRGVVHAAESAPSTQCNDGIDNDGDGKADQYGVDKNKDGILEMEPDPSCFSPGATTENPDDVVRDSSGKLIGVVPCTDKCTFSDVFKLLNNFLTFFITTLLIPIFIIIVMYAGYKYLKAGASGGQKADVKKMLGNIIGGVVLILCSWLIVRTIMTTLLNDDFKQNGVEFLGQ